MSAAVERKEPCEVCGRLVTWPEAHCRECDYCEECGACHRWRVDRAVSWRRRFATAFLEPFLAYERIWTRLRVAVETPLEAWVRRGALRDRRDAVAREEGRR